MAETFPINIWINEERYEKLQDAGLGEMAQEMLAGLKVLRVPTTAEQRDALLKKYPIGQVRQRHHQEHRATASGM